MTTSKFLSLADEAYSYKQMTHAWNRKDYIADNLHIS